MEYASLYEKALHTVDIEKTNRIHISQIEQTCLRRFVENKAQQIGISLAVFVVLVAIILGCFVASPLFFCLSFSLAAFWVGFLSSGSVLEKLGYFYATGGHSVNDALMKAEKADLNQKRREETIQRYATDKLKRKAYKNINLEKQKPRVLEEVITHDKQTHKSYFLLRTADKQTLDQKVFDTENLHESYDLMATWREVEDALQEKALEDFQNKIQQKFQVDIVAKKQLRQQTRDKKRQQKQLAKTEKQTEKRQQKQLAKHEKRMDQEIKEFQRRF